jgi:PAS domain S-box-containing protein
MRSLPPRPIDASARLPWLPAWVLIVGLVLTAALGVWSFQRESDQRRTVLEREAREVARALENKVQSYLDTLPGLRVYGMLQESPTDAEFLHYVQALSLQERYPGLGVSFIAEIVSEDGRTAFEARARADRSVRAQGHPDFVVRPPGPRSDYMVLRHLYPEDPPAFGYDLYDPSQPYRADVERALATGRYVATGPLQLARDRNKPLDPTLTSIVVRAALYRGGSTPPTEAERRARALGVVGIGFRVQPLMSSVLPPHLAQAMRLRVVDEQALAGAVKGLLFDSAPDHQTQATAPFWSGRITVADRQWTLMAYPQGGAWAGQESTGILVLFGAGLSLALAALTRTLAQANLKAEAQLGDAAHALMRERDQLQLSEARFRMLFEHSFDAVLRTRPDGRVLEANPSACTLFGGTVETLQALSRERLVDMTDPRVATLLEERHRSGRAAGALRMRRVDGSLFEAELSSNIYIDGDGEQATSMIIRDVTERQRLAERLQEKQRLEAIGTLAGGVAHDFNNMLAAILGNVGLAEQDIPPDSPAQARLRLVRQAGNRARQLVRQILTFSRRAPREQAVQLLQPLVDEALALLRSTLPPTVRLQVLSSPVPLWARVDGAQVQQLLLNLCTNAWQALPDENGEVRVALQSCTLAEPEARLLGLAAGEYACLHVDDDGHGMDATVRARIFEPFFTTKPAGRGTGLGLAVVHGVVTEHAGAIRVESEVGRGTHFSVYLPLASVPATEADDALPQVPARPAATGHAAVAGERCARILYVDDDEVVALTALALLQRAGYEVQIAASGEAALAALHATGEHCDLVVTDFNMPGLSGLAVAEWVQQTLPGTRVILVSGLVTDELQQRARQLGIPEVLPKEEMLERLLHAVQRALAPPG